MHFISDAGMVVSFAVIIRAIGMLKAPRVIAGLFLFMPLARIKA
jgi:hypothetical protein